jgi:hypothetical protein
LRDEKFVKKKSFIALFCCDIAGAIPFSMRQKGAPEAADEKVSGTKHKKLKVPKVN